MKWDLDADVVCTGFGAAGLATISVVDLGGDVFVAPSINGTPGPSVEPFALHRDRLHPWLPADVSDTETSDYLAALWSDEMCGMWMYRSASCGTTCRGGAHHSSVRRCSVTGLDGALPDVPVRISSHPGPGLGDDNTAHHRR